MEQEHRVTWRALIVGYILAQILCAINSYLTLSFGIMEEGPTIAAIFFFAIFGLSRTKITTAEMIMVATLGSAGGTLGFMANFFAAQAMIVAAQDFGEPYTIFQMTMFTTVSSLIGLVFVIPMRHILIIKDAELPEEKRLPWVGATAIQGVIDALVEESNAIQGRYLLAVTVSAILWVVFNDSGIGWTPECRNITLFGLASVGGALAFSPFLIGASFLMSIRHCIGFFVGGLILMLIANHTPNPAAPHTFVWPGVMFLTTSGLTALAMNWRVIVGAMTSLFHLRGGKDEDPMMSRNTMIIFTIVALSITVAFLYFQFEIGLMLIVSMIIIGGLVLNMIATRAAAQTYFNPARVMGILMMGFCSIFGTIPAAINIAGAGSIAGSGAQGGTLTNDLALGFRYKFPSRWQFWAQISTVLTCSFVAGLVFWLIRTNMDITMETEDLAAPIAKTWAAMAMLFDPNFDKPLPPLAIKSMWIAGIAGVLYTLAENGVNFRLADSKMFRNIKVLAPIIRWEDNNVKIGEYLPGSIGLGLGLILPVGYDFGFMFGGLVMFLVLSKYLHFSKTTLNTLAIALIVGEGIGGIIQGIMNTILKAMASS